MVINNNIPALYAYTNMLTVNDNVSKAMRRLSSGVRINSVKDDPAGMAMSNKLKSQVRGLNMADRNSLDAISMIQTSDGSLQQMHDMLNRMKELTVQSANGTNSPEERDKIQAEIAELIDEINSTSAKTEFNNIKLLSGDAARLTKSSDTKNIKCTYISDNVYLGQLKYDIISVGTPAQYTSNASNFTGPISGSLIINGEEIKFENESPDTAISKLTELCDRNNIEIAIEDGGTWGDYLAGTKKIMLYTKEEGSAEKISISGDTSVMASFGFITTLVKGTDAKIAANAKYGNENMSVVANGNKLVFTGANAKTIELKIQIKDKPEADFSWLMADGLNNVNVYNKAGNTLDVLDFGVMKFQIGPDQDMELAIQIPSVSAESLGIDKINVSTTQGALKALDIIDAAQQKLSTIRARLGAFQNRLEYTSKSLNVAAENTSTSLSRIYDADMALEMMNMTQNNIISQAGMAILSQANQRPQQLLQLLQ